MYGFGPPGPCSWLLLIDPCSCLTLTFTGGGGDNGIDLVGSTGHALATGIDADGGLWSVGAALVGGGQAGGLIGTTGPAACSVLSGVNCICFGVGRSFVIDAGDLQAVALAFLIVSPSSSGLRLVCPSLPDGRGGGVGVLTLAKVDAVRQGVIVLVMGAYTQVHMTSLWVTA